MIGIPLLCFVMHICIYAGDMCVCVCICVVYVNTMHVSEKNIENFIFKFKDFSRIVRIPLFGKKNKTGNKIFSLYLPLFIFRQIIQLVRNIREIFCLSLSIINHQSIDRSNEQRLIFILN